MTRSSRLPLFHFVVAVAAFGLAALMAVMQAMSRSGMALPGRTEQIYYLSVTAHGVLMALVFTTFFIMGLGYLVVERALEVPLQGNRLAWASFWMTLLGSVLALLPIVAGKASVLYTFYPPLQAHPLFYLGLTLLVVGSWGWCAVFLRAFFRYRRAHPLDPIPLAAHGMMAAVLVWILSSPAVAVEVLVLLLPWSLGLVKSVDPLLARALFWFFGHPLVYFWLLPAYVIWYTVLPGHLGGKLFSDRLARVVFVLFIVLSTPVGFHHQFMDPGISARWKLLHTMTTYAILLPSFMTAFTILASMELSGRLRGGQGLWGWIRFLPWGDPFFTSVACSMVLFALGGFGGAVNAAYGMNAMIHNTAWVQGHFHLTVGSAVALTFMGFTYWVLPRLTGKALRFAAWAQVQPFLWLAGMLFFSISNHVTGLLGMPRRVYEASYGGSETAATWASLTSLSAAGGVVLFVSALSFLLVVFGTLWGGTPTIPADVAFSQSLDLPEAGSVWDRLSLWFGVAIFLVAVAYALPLWHLVTMGAPGSPGYKPY